MSTVVPNPQGVGISWECATGNHAACHTPGCRCFACHYQRPTQRDQRELVSTPIERTANPSVEADKNAAPPPVVHHSDNIPICPKCGRLATVQEDKFCRYDGAMLQAPMTHCGNCGTQAPKTDAYCGNCGAPLTKEITVVKAKRRKKAPATEEPNE